MSTEEDLRADAELILARFYELVEENASLKALISNLVDRGCGIHEKQGNCEGCKFYKKFDVEPPLDSFCELTTHAYVYMPYRGLGS